MNIRRVVPDIVSTRFDESRTFYGDFLGMRMAMDLGFIVTYVSQSNETAQVSITRPDGEPTPPNGMSLSIEVEDVDELYRGASERGLEIVYPLTDEPWGVRRFFVRDPNGVVVNILKHLPKSK
jgi:catechol 2,3-dioxygenase-like lactoylglutathione lyase family enzyme